MLRTITRWILLLCLFDLSASLSTLPRGRLAPETRTGHVHLFSIPTMKGSNASPRSADGFKRKALRVCSTAISAFSVGAAPAMGAVLRRVPPSTSPTLLTGVALLILTAFGMVLSAVERRREKARIIRTRKLFAEEDALESKLKREREMKRRRRMRRDDDEDDDEDDEDDD